VLFNTNTLETPFFSFFGRVFFSAIGTDTPSASALLWAPCCRIRVPPRKFITSFRDGRGRRLFPRPFSDPLYSEVQRRRPLDFQNPTQWPLSFPFPDLRFAFFFFRTRWPAPPAPDKQPHVPPSSGWRCFLLPLTMLAPLLA